MITEYFLLKRIGKKGIDFIKFYQATMVDITPNQILFSE